MGNRGILHNGEGEIIRRQANRAAITCRLEFRGRHRSPRVLDPHRYTQLFFLDEATAYAAGHRPCAECRRADYRAFGAAFRAGTPGAIPRAADIDRILHADRAGERPTVTDVPDGAIIAASGSAFLRWHGWWRWSFDGYRPEEPVGEMRLLTPTSIVRALRSGLELTVDPSVLPAP